jgi:hypothetical protein
VVRELEELGDVDPATGELLDGPLDDGFPDGSPDGSAHHQGDELDRPMPGTVTSAA